MIVQVDKFCRGRPGVYAAATGSIRLESLFLTLSTRALTGRSSGTPTRYVKTAESCRKSRHSFWAIAACPFYACAVDNPQKLLAAGGDDHAALALLAAAGSLAAFCVG